MPDGKLTNHDMIREVYQAMNDPGGLREQISESRKELHEIKDSLVGTLEKPGLIRNFKAHVEDHVRERRRNLAILGAIATILATVIPAILRRLGLL